MKRDEQGTPPYSTQPAKPRGTGPDSAGQSGDTQGIDNPDELELLEEGQFYEAEVIESVEDAPDADPNGIRVRQVPADDVPGEYEQQDEDRHRD